MRPPDKNGSGAGGAARGAKAVEPCGPTPSHTPKHHRSARGRRAVLSAIGPAGAFTVRGQTAKALKALLHAGDSGITALECNSWAFRLAAYVHELRRRHGLAIEMLREPHGDNGDWHGRYVLRSPVWPTRQRQPAGGSEA